MLVLLDGHHLPALTPEGRVHNGCRALQPVQFERSREHLRVVRPRIHRDDVVAQCERDAGEEAHLRAGIDDDPRRIALEQLLPVADRSRLHAGYFTSKDCG